MARISIIVAVALFCILTAPAPNPRVLAALDALSNYHTHQMQGDADGSFYCPMDPEVRSLRPGKCPRCGMTLVEGVPELLEYPLNLTFDPPIPRATQPTRVTFGVVDPKSSQPVRSFQVVHEKLYHVFVVSQDLAFFLHTHPERDADQDFHLDVSFPKPGLYRVLSDFFPSGGTPQLITNTVIVPGAAAPLASARIQADTLPKDSENARVELRVDPTRTIARQKTSLHFRITPDEGLEPYLGTWGHMLAASADLIDMVHNHPVTGLDAPVQGDKLQFDLAFPRAGVYRVWVQFQRLGVVNTVAFNIPVDESTAGF